VSYDKLLNFKTQISVWLKNLMLGEKLKGKEVLYEKHLIEHFVTRISTM
jgi:hypothetical protein